MASDLSSLLASLREEGHSDEYILEQLRSMDEHEFYVVTSQMMDAGVPDHVIREFWQSFASNRMTDDEEGQQDLPPEDIDWDAVTALQDRYTEISRIVDPADRLAAAKALVAEMNGGE